MLTLRCVEWLACNQADAESAVILQRLALASMRPLEGATKTSDSFQVISRSEHGAIALLDPPVGEQGQTPRRPSVDGALVKALRIKWLCWPQLEPLENRRWPLPYRDCYVCALGDVERTTAGDWIAGAIRPLGASGDGHGGPLRL